MDLELIAGYFFYDDIVPKEQRYLLKYFTSEPQRRLLVYTLTFAEFRLRHGAYKFYRCFVDHTGTQVSMRFIQKWIVRLKELEAKLEEANSSFDLEMVETIKTGKYRF